MILQVDTDIALNQLTPSDAADIVRTSDLQREYLGRWLPFVEFTKEISDTIRFVDSIVNAPEDSFEYVFVIRKRNEFVGLIGFKDTDRLNKKTEIGYWLSQTFQRQGIMTKSVERLCHFAFESGIHRIQLKCAVGNNPSKNIPKRLGFKFEGIERHGEILTGNIYTDLEIYSKLQTD